MLRIRCLIDQALLKIPVEQKHECKTPCCKHAVHHSEGLCAQIAEVIFPSPHSCDVSPESPDYHVVPIVGQAAAALSNIAS
jgi:hypothetical protein